MNKNELFRFINDNPVFSLATCEENTPHVRTMMVVKTTEAGVIFNIKKYKPVYRQLIANPNVELCFYSQNLMTQVRISGKVTEIFDAILVDEILSNHPYLLEQIEKYGNDVIRLFEVKDWIASLWDRKNMGNTRLCEFK